MTWVVRAVPVRYSLYFIIIEKAINLLMAFLLLYGGSARKIA